MKNTQSITSVFIDEFAFSLYQSKKITIQEALMLSLIKALDNEKGCFATNKYFADNLPIEVDRVKEIIRSLVKKGYVKSQMINNNTRRILNVVTDKASETLEEVKGAVKEVAAKTKEVVKELVAPAINKSKEIKQGYNTYKSKVSRKVQEFNTMLSHEWGFDVIGRLEALKIDLKLGLISEDKYMELASPLLAMGG